MTKKEVIESLAHRLGSTQKHAAEVLEAMTAMIEEEVAAGRKVNVTGFGAFELSHRSAREGVDPRTGERIKIPAIITPHFRAGSHFKAMVRG